MSEPQTKIMVFRRDGATEEQILPPGDYVVGQDATAQIQLDGDVESRHARLKHEDGAWMVEDLGSLAGTFLDDQPVKESTVVRPGQRIRVGEVEIQFEHVASGDSVGSHTHTPVSVHAMSPGEMRGSQKYNVGRMVARGGMGVIMSARDLAAQREVAMKLMIDCSKPEAVARFCQEAQVTAQLEHPNIVPVHDMGANDKDQPYYTMKYVRGTSLKKVLHGLINHDPVALSQWPLGGLLTVFQKICDALAFAHSRSVVHRDLKPDNVMLGEYGEALVMDWGLAKVLDRAHSSTRAHRPAPEAAPAANGEPTPAPPHDETTVGPTTVGTVMGTPQYMSPEQAAGDVAAIDERSDIYALGAILYHLLTLRPPFHGRNSGEVLQNVRAGRIVPFGEACAGKRLAHLPGERVPESLAAVVTKAMAFKKEDRYPNVKTLQAEIVAYQTGFATVAEEAGLWKLLGLFLRRHRTVSLAAMLLVVSGVIFSIYLAQARNRAEHHAAEAGAARVVADQQRDAAEDQLYLSDMLQAGRHLAVGRPESARELLTRHRREPSGRDLRGWEWFYLTGQLNKDRLRVPAHEGGVFALAVSADATLIATAGGDGTVAVWQTRGLLPRYRLPASPSRVLTVAWHGNGRFLAAGGADGFVRVWDVETQQNVAECQVSAGQAVRSIAWKPRDEGAPTLAIGSHEKEIMIWQPLAAEKPQPFVTTENGVASLHWSADGARLAVGGLETSRSLEVFDYAKRAKLLSTRAGSGDEVLAAAIDPAGNYVAAGSKNLSVVVYDLASKSPLLSGAIHRGFVSALAWSPDGRELASGSHDGTIRVAEPRDAKAGPRILTGHEGEVNALAWTRLPALPGGAVEAHALFSGGADGTLRAWLPTGVGESAFTAPPVNWISSAAWSPDGSRFALANFRNHLHLVDPTTGLNIALCSTPGGVFDLAWSPDGNRVATASRSAHRVEVLDAVNGRTLGLYGLNRVHRVAWSPSGRYLAGCGREGVRVWDTTTGEVLGTIARPAGSIAWQADERRIVVGGEDGAVQLWEVQGGRMIAEWRAAPTAEIASVSTDKEPPRQVFDLRWSPDGRFVAFVTQDSEAGLIDVKTSKVVQNFSGHSSGVWRVAWSPDGRRLATVGQDACLRVYDPVSGGQVAHISHGLGKEELQALGWSPDGRQILTGGYDRHVRVWNALRGYRLESYTQRVGQAAGNLEALRPLARAATELGWAGEARRIFDTARKSAPDDTALLNDAAGAEAAFVQTLDTSPLDLEPLRPSPVRDRRAIELLATIHSSWEEGKADAAVRAYRELAKLPDAAQSVPLAQTYLSRARWTATWFSSEADPQQDLEAWRAQAAGANALTQTVRHLGFPYQNRGPKDLFVAPDLAEGEPGAQHFGMIARTRLNLPAGKWRCQVSGSDGARVLVDGRAVLEHWPAGDVPEKSAEHEQAGSGVVEIAVEHFVLTGSPGFQYLLWPADE